MTRKELESAEIGGRVTYVPEYGNNEKGRIKSFTNKDHVYVVYKSQCGGNWNEFQNYTAARTRRQDLKFGW